MNNQRNWISVSKSGGTAFVALFAVGVLIACGGNPPPKKKVKKQVEVEVTPTPHPELMEADELTLDVERFLERNQIYEAHHAAKRALELLVLHLPEGDPKIVDMKQIEFELRRESEALFELPEGVPKNWPRYDGGFDGTMEIAVRNPNNYRVRVGVTSQGLGVDFIVPANGRQSVLVPNDGYYDVFFQYSSDPASTYQGDTVRVYNAGTEIQIVEIKGGNYNIKRLP